MVGISFVESFIAVGAKSQKTPILHINRNRTNGTTLNSIDGILEIYF
jgi:hypothetical protein